MLSLPLHPRFSGCYPIADRDIDKAMDLSKILRSDAEYRPISEYDELRYSLRPDESQARREMAKTIRNQFRLQDRDYERFETAILVDSTSGSEDKLLLVGEPAKTISDIDTFLTANNNPTLQAALLKAKQDIVENLPRRFIKINGEFNDDVGFYKVNTVDFVI